MWGKGFSGFQGFSGFFGFIGLIGLGFLIDNYIENKRMEKKFVD